MLLLVIEGNKLQWRFLQSNLIFVRQVIVCDVSIPVAVFDYVHWKLPIPSFLLKSLFSFFKRRGSVRPRNILFTISTYASYQYFSNQVTTSRQLIRSWTQMHSIKPQSHRACDHVTTYVRPQNKTNRWQIMRLILEVVGGRNKVDGHVPNARPTITNRKRSQIGRTWSCDESSRVVPLIAHNHELTSRVTGLATDCATMRLVVPFVEQFHDRWYDLLGSVTTGCTTLNWSCDQLHFAGSFTLKGLIFKITLDIWVIPESLKSH